MKETGKSFNYIALSDWLSNCHSQNSGWERFSPILGLPESPPLPYMLLASLSGLGFAETGYLTLNKLAGSTPVCPISGCATVLNSSYSEVYGIPLSLFGMLAYGGVAGLAIAASQANKKDQPTDTLDLLVATGSTLLGGVSGMLLWLLSTKFEGETCVWCLASAAISFSLLATVVSKMPSRKLAAAAMPSLGAVTAAVLALSLSLGTAEPSNADEEFSLPYTAPIISTTSTPDAVTLAKRLKDAGARMYGAFWCSHCFDQKESFGKEAMEYFPYEECFPEGWKRGVKIAPACDAAGVKAFPTWVINGKTLEGQLSLEMLEAQLEP